MELHPSVTEKVEDSFRIPDERCLQPDGRWCQFQDLSTPKMEFSGASSDALVPVTMAPTHSETDEDGNYET